MRTSRRGDGVGGEELGGGGRGSSELSPDCGPLVGLTGDWTTLPVVLCIDFIS